MDVQMILYHLLLSVSCPLRPGKESRNIEEDISIARYVLAQSDIDRTNCTYPDCFLLCTCGICSFHFSLVVLQICLTRCRLVSITWGLPFTTSIFIL